MTIQPQFEGHSSKFIEGNIFRGILTLIFSVIAIFPVALVEGFIIDLLYIDVGVAFGLSVGIVFSVIIGFYAGKYIQWLILNRSHVSKNMRIDFGGTIGRAKFAKMQIVGLLSILASNLIMVFAGSGILAILIFFINIIVLTKFLIAPAAQRTRSLGLNPWLALVLLVPLVNFAFYIFLLAGPEGAARSLRSEN